VLPLHQAAATSATTAPSWRSSASAVVEFLENSSEGDYSSSSTASQTSVVTDQLDGQYG
jgi:hypothetical protein